MQRFKRIITWFLLIFVAAAIVTVLRPRETVFLPDGRCILFWHAETRCSNCLKMETLLRQVLREQKGFHLITLEYDVFANQSLAQQFGVGMTTIILVERKNRQSVRIRDLTTEVWKNIHDESAFIDMLREELETFWEREPLADSL